MGVESEKSAVPRQTIPIVASGAKVKYAAYVSKAVCISSLRCSYATVPLVLGLGFVRELHSILQRTVVDSTASVATQVFRHFYQIWVRMNLVATSEIF